MLPSDPLSGKISPSTTLWEGDHLRVLREGRWEFVERKTATGGVVIVATTERSELVLIDQYRVPMRGRVIELPAGLVGDIPGQETESLITAARRELLEETGYEADDWTILTCGPSSPGLSNETNTMLRASQARRVSGGGGDGHENIIVHIVPMTLVSTWLNEQIQCGRSVDPKVYAALYFVTGSS